MNENVRDRRRGELVTLLAESVTGIDHTLGPHEPLISSGRVNSLALFKLVLWIEEQSARPIDIAAIDITQAWDTAEQILDFLERAAEA
jgi:hypothetical protein